jgi:hypothetical protein
MPARARIDGEVGPFQIESGKLPGTVRFDELT